MVAENTLNTVRPTMTCPPPMAPEVLLPVAVDEDSVLDLVLVPVADPVAAPEPVAVAADPAVVTVNTPPSGPAEIQASAAVDASAAELGGFLTTVALPLKSQAVAARF